MRPRTQHVQANLLVIVSDGRGSAPEPQVRVCNVVLAPEEIYDFVFFKRVELIVNFLEKRDICQLQFSCSLV